LTESQYLAKQAADAKAAISNSIAELGRELSQSADPRAWMQVHPWATLGAAAVAGFAAAGLMVPSKEEQALNRLAKLEAALNVKDHNGNGHHNPDRNSSKPESPSLLVKLAHTALTAAQPLISSVIAGMTANMTAQPDPNADSKAAPSPVPEAPPSDAGI